MTGHRYSIADTGRRSFVARAGASVIALLVTGLPAAGIAEPQGTRGSGNTELLKAASLGDENAVIRLLGAGVDPDSRSPGKHGRTALILAAAGGHTESVRALLDKGAGLELRDDAGLTALNWAALRGHLPVAELLLARGADVNTHSKAHVTPLLYAVGTGIVALLDLFAANGADLDAESRESSMTPLLLAIENRDLSSVDRLVLHGAAPDKPNSDGLRPLDAARSKGDRRIIEALVQAGARP